VAETAEPEPEPEPAPTPTPDPGAAVESPPGLETLTGTWQAVIESLAAEQPLLAAVMVKARPVALAGDELTLAFANEDAFLRRRAEDQASRAVVGEALRTVCGRSLRLAFELRDAQELVQDCPPVPTDEEWVARFMAEFDAEELLAEEAAERASETAATPQPQES